MNIAKSPEFIKDNEVVRLENMEFDVVGSKLRTRRGLITPLASFNSPVTHVYNDYEMNDFFVFLENKEVYSYEFGKQPIFIGKKLIEMQNALPVVNGKVLYLLQVGLNYKNTIIKH